MNARTCRFLVYSACRALFQYPLLPAANAVTLVMLGSSVKGFLTYVG